MSWRHAYAAGLYQLDDPVAKAVLNALAFHANDFSGQAWPSVARLERFTALARRSVQNGLRRLVAEGLIEDKGPSKKGSVIYQLRLPETPPIEQGGAPDAPPPVQDVHPPRAGGAPKESGNNQKEQTRAPLTLDWKPGEQTLAWLKERWPDADVTVEVERFINRNLAEGKEITNVDAAFRAWCLRGVQLAAGQADRGGRLQLASGADRLRARRSKPVERP